MFKQSKDRKILLLFFIWLSIFPMGCKTGILTSEHSGSITNKGVSYFLPRNEVRVVFTNATIASEIQAATKVLEAAKSDAAASTKKFDGAKKAWEAAAPKNQEELNNLQKSFKEAEIAGNLAKRKVEQAEKNLTNKKEEKPQVLIEVLPPVPDTSKLYVAALKHSWLNDDTVTFKTSPEGLLTQVTYKGQDKTGEIVQNLVETGIEAAKLYARLHGYPIPATDAEKTTLLDKESCTPKEEKDGQKYYWEFTINPSVSLEVAAVNYKLLQTPLPFLVNIRKPDKVINDLPPIEDPVAGLLYRRAIPYTIEILENRTQKEEICNTIMEIEHWKLGQDLPTSPPTPDQIKALNQLVNERREAIPTSKSQQVLMVAGGPVSVLEFGDRPFVTTDLQATFKQGVLLDSIETRPSEVAGFTMIPLNAVRAVGNAIGSIVTNIVQFKIDHTNKTKELIEAETELEKAKQANAELQKKILSQFESVDQQAQENP